MSLELCFIVTDQSRLLYRQMTNVTRHSSNPVNTDLVYYFVQYYDDFLANSDENDTLAVTTAEDTCQLMLSIDVQQAALVLRYVIVTQCQSWYH